MSSNMTSSAQGNSGVRTQFKTPEGRYKLAREKTTPAGMLHYSHNRATTKVTFVQLKDRPSSCSAAGSSSSTGGGGSRFSTSRLLGSGNGGGMRFGSSGNGSSRRPFSGNNASSSGATNNGPASGTGGFQYVVYNVGDGLFIADYSTPDKEPVRTIHFANPCHPSCHAFSQTATSGHDLVIGTTGGDIYSVQLRQQLTDSGRKLVGATHYNKDGAVNPTRCMAVAWVPNKEGFFLAAHADGNIYLYDKNKDGSSDVAFPPIKDPAVFSVAHARSSKSNPVSRWHISGSAINDMAFSPDGNLLATVGRDGYLRVFDFVSETVVGGHKSYYGALLCCAWSGDNRCVLTGGEDDLVSLYSLDLQSVVVWGEGHNSWVSAAAFDPYWQQPPSEESTAAAAAEEPVNYRFASVGQDTQMLLWDFAMEDVVPMARHRPRSTTPSPGLSPKAGVVGGHTAAGLSLSGSALFSKGDHTAGGAQAPLAPSALRKEVPKLGPIMAHRVHAEPLSDVVFTRDSILTACHEGLVKIWLRPDAAGNQDEAPLDTGQDPPARASWEGGAPSLRSSRGGDVVGGSLARGPH